MPIHHPTVRPPHRPFGAGGDTPTQPFIRPLALGRIAAAAFTASMLAGCGGGGDSGSTGTGASTGAGTSTSTGGTGTGSSTSTGGTGTGSSTSTGGTGTGTTTAPVVASTGTSLSGVASKGPLKRALITAFPVSDAGVVGSQELAHTTTDGAANSTGAYTLFLGSYAGVVHLVLTAPTGTTTADEASSTDIPLPTSFSLHANAAVAGSTVNVTQSASITPFTELAHRIAAAAGGITAGNIANANGVVFALIGVDPVATQPVASNAVPGTAITDAQKRYGLFNAAVSKLASAPAQTADTATLACLTAAAGDAGKKIDCIVRQIAGAVTVTGTGAQAVTSVNNRMVGMADALVAASADAAINKTGAVIASTNSAVKTLASLEAAAVAGTPTAVNGGTSGQARSDVAVAKAFFSGLRSNAASLKSDAIGTGIVDGVKVFGDTLRDEAAMVTHRTLQFVDLGRTAATLWHRYKDGLTTTPSSTLAGTANGCTIYQGAFPAQYGPAGAAIGTPYAASSVAATSPANAKWVGCSYGSHTLMADGPKDYRQNVLIDMSSDPTLSVVPYLAATRAVYVKGGVTYYEMLTPTLKGVFNVTIANDEVTAVSLVGDLPPQTTRDGVLRAARYAVNIGGALGTSAAGVSKLTLSHGSLGLVPVGASSPTLVVDLSVAGSSFAMIPDDLGDPSTLKSLAIDLAVSISDAHGRLTGNLLLDQFTRDDSNDTEVGHVKFVGDLAVAPVINGTSSALVSFLSGQIEATSGATPGVSFSGALTLPNRPAVTLAGSAIETSADTYSFEARYVQAGITVNLLGAKKPGDLSGTFADSTGVSLSVAKAANKSNVTVGGRQTAVFDLTARTIIYADGTFESLL